MQCWSDGFPLRELVNWAHWCMFASCSCQYFRTTARSIYDTLKQPRVLYILLLSFFSSSLILYFKVFVFHFLLATNCGPLLTIFSSFPLLGIYPKTNHLPSATVPGVTTVACFGTTPSKPTAAANLIVLARYQMPGTHTKQGFLIALFILAGYEPRLLLSMDSKSDNGWTRPVLRGNDHRSCMPHGYREPSALHRCAPVVALLTEPSIFLDNFQCPKLHAD